jgi:hypothetical protein
MGSDAGNGAGGSGAASGRGLDRRQLDGRSRGRERYVDGKVGAAAGAEPLLGCDPRRAATGAEPESSRHLESPARFKGLAIGRSPVGVGWRRSTISRGTICPERGQPSLSTPKRPALVHRVT